MAYGRSPAATSTASETSSSSGVPSPRRVVLARSGGSRCCSGSPALTGSTRPSISSTTRAGGARWPRLLLRNRLEPVAHAVAGLDEGVARRAPVDLLPQPPDEHVHGSIAMRLSPAPDLLEQLVPCHHTPALEGQLVEEAELGRCELCAFPVDERLHLSWIDPELLDLDRLATCGVSTP